MPVEDAEAWSWNDSSFWYYPWGRSVVHKGVDIFADEGTNIPSSTNGMVIYTGNSKIAGNHVLILGPKWRIHHYAHLNEIKTKRFCYVKAGELIGTVGTTGNAKGRPPHLHYSIRTMAPRFWKIDKSRQGWKKMFYINPIPYLHQSLK